MQLSQDKDLIDLEFNCICQRENYPILEIPIFSFERYGGTSTTSWFSAIALYWGAFRLRKSLRRTIKKSREEEMVLNESTINQISRIE